MLGSDILEVAIGVIFVFLLVSLIAAAVREGIEAWLKSRAAYLEHGLRELLRDKAGEGLARALYEHPLISGLYSGEYKPGSKTTRPSKVARGGELPSYLPTRNVALALMDLAARGPVSMLNSGATAAPVSAETIRANIRNIQNPAIQRVLLTALDAAHDDLDRARRELEAWYDSAMDRVSGWYKRSTHWMLFFIGCTVAILLNVNTIAIATFLNRNPAARAAAVASAGAAGRDSATLNLGYQQSRAALDSLNLPIGWAGMDFGIPGSRYKAVWEVRITTRDSATHHPTVVRRRTQTVYKTRGWWSYLLSPMLGWLLTGVAATLGAPFWFDVLNKVMVIRSTVKPHEKSREEGSEDRQTKTRSTDALPSAGTQVNTTPAAAASQEPAQPAAAGGLGGAPTGGAAAGAAADSSELSPPDAESTLEGCHVSVEVPTSDEDLPQAEGGIC